MCSVTVFLNVGFLALIKYSRLLVFHVFSLWLVLVCHPWFCWVHLLLADVRECLICTANMVLNLSFAFSFYFWWFSWLLVLLFYNQVHHAFSLWFLRCFHDPSSNSSNFLKNQYLFRNILWSLSLIRNVCTKQFADYPSAIYGIRDSFPDEKWHLYCTINSYIRGPIPRLVILSHQFLSLMMIPHWLVVSLYYLWMSRSTGSRGTEREGGARNPHPRQTQWASDTLAIQQHQSLWTVQGWVYCFVCLGVLVWFYPMESVAKVKGKNLGSLNLQMPALPGQRRLAAGFPPRCARQDQVHSVCLHCPRP